MAAILEAMDTAILQGRKVYLHCWGGIGRTGTVVGCYLVHQGLEGGSALQHLKELYRSSQQFTFFPYVPETDEQVEFVLHWGTPSPLPLSPGERGEE
jgi:protein-tyrosine phosphatase